MAFQSCRRKLVAHFQLRPFRWMITSSSGTGCGQACHQISGRIMNKRPDDQNRVVQRNCRMPTNFSRGQWRAPWQFGVVISHVSPLTYSGSGVRPAGTGRPSAPEPAPSGSPTAPRTAKVIAAEPVDIDLVDKGHRVVARLALHQGVDHTEGVEQRIGDVDDQQEKPGRRQQRERSHPRTGPWPSGCRSEPLRAPNAGSIARPDRKKMKLTGTCFQTETITIAEAVSLSSSRPA